MKNYTLILSFLIFIPIFSVAQVFEKAPVSNVQKITEWIQNNWKAVEKGTTYYFDKKGLLTGYEQTYAEDYPGDTGAYEYDSQDRIIGKTLKFGYNTALSEFVYHPNYYVEYEEFKGNYYKYIYFSDENKRLVEMKTYLASFDSNEELELFDRTIYTYDKTGRLTGETLYKYWELEKPSAQITLYSYYLGSKSVKLKRAYDPIGKLEYETSYTYDKKGQLTQKLFEFISSGKKNTTKYKYEKGQLWTEEYDDGDFTETNIYKKGRLIRKRIKWRTGATEVTDYQYTFYAQ